MIMNVLVFTSLHFISILRSPSNDPGSRWICNNAILSHCTGAVCWLENQRLHSPVVCQTLASLNKLVDVGRIYHGSQDCITSLALMRQAMSQERCAKNAAAGSVHFRHRRQMGCDGAALSLVFTRKSETAQALAIVFKYKVSASSLKKTCCFSFPLIFSITMYLTLKLLLCYYVKNRTDTQRNHSIGQEILSI